MPESNRHSMAAAEGPSDEELIARIASGDREAFASLYRRRRPDVYRFALHVSGSPAVADDVTQDVFMAVIHDAGRYGPERSGVVPWLLGITRNHVRRSLNRGWRLVPSPDVDARAPRQLAVEPDPLAGLARRQHADALRTAVRELPLKFREAVVLCDLQELSYADAAAALGCAIGTVRSRLDRGRALAATLAWVIAPRSVHVPAPKSVTVAPTDAARVETPMPARESAAVLPAPRAGPLCGRADSHLAPRLRLHASRPNLLRGPARPTCRGSKAVT